MTAILGWLGGLDSPTLERMHQRLHHRGACVQGVEFSGPGMLAVAAGQRSQQHLASIGDVIVVVDGHLYQANDTEDPAQSASTAERMAQLYVSRGARMIDALNGDFALALWDGSRRRLVLARDFAGAKPLYFTKLADGTTAFASEYKALVGLPGFDATVDREMLQLLQYVKHLPSERTLFRSVHAVAPGAVIAIDREGHVMPLARAAAVELRVGSASEDELQRRIAESFCETVRVRTRSAQRIGIALSGGIDSISVAFACRKENPSATIHAFTAGSGPDDPEVRTAALVSERLGAQHHVVTVTPAAVAERLPETIWHMEAPIARSETIQFFELGKAAHGVVDTMLTGAAADALYAGMPNHKILRLYERMPGLRRGLHEFHSLTQTGYAPVSLQGKLMRAAYFRGSLPPVPRIQGASHRPALRRLPPLGPELLNEYLHADFPEHVAQWLPKVERTLAAFGVEFTSPFLDPRCASVAFTIPARLKLHRWREKFILRRALRALVGRELTDFPKFPMRMTYDDAFADHLDDLVRRYLSPERVKARGFFDPQTLEPVREYRRGGRYSAEGAMRAWTAVGTEIWAEQFLDRTGRSAA